VIGYLVPRDRRRIDGAQAVAEQVNSLRGIGQCERDGDVKAAEQCVVEQGSVIGHRDEEAFRLGVIEEREKHVEDATGVHDVIPGRLPRTDRAEFVKEVVE